MTRTFDQTPQRRGRLSGTRARLRPGGTDLTQEGFDSLSELPVPGASGRLQRTSRKLARPARLAAAVEAARGAIEAVRRPGRLARLLPGLAGAGQSLRDRAVLSGAAQELRLPVEMRRRGRGLGGQ